MTGKFEIMNYIDRDKILDNHKVIVSDAGYDNDMVYIKMTDKEGCCYVAKVVGWELIKAVENCMYLNLP